MIKEYAAFTFLMNNDRRNELHLISPSLGVGTDLYAVFITIAEKIIDSVNYVRQNYWLKAAGHKSRVLFEYCVHFNHTPSFMFGSTEEVRTPVSRLKVCYPSLLDDGALFGGSDGI